MKNETIEKLNAAQLAAEDAEYAARQAQYKLEQCESEHGRRHWLSLDYQAETTGAFRHARELRAEFEKLNAESACALIARAKGETL